MNIDWSKAPADATHWEPAFLGVGESWMKLESAVWSFWSISWIGWIASPVSHQRISRMIARPAPVEWDGTGLPPVGTVCEIKGTVLQEVRRENPTWRKVDIIAHTDFGGKPIAVGRDIKCSTLGWGMATMFRPIKTPEQLAAEERRKVINQMMTDAGIVGSAFDGDPEADIWCEALYEAGWRKELRQ